MKLQSRDKGILQQIFFAAVLFFFLFFSYELPAQYSHGHASVQVLKVRHLYAEKTSCINLLRTSPPYLDTAYFIAPFSSYKLYLSGSIYAPEYHRQAFMDTDCIVNLTYAGIVKSRVFDIIEFKVKKFRPMKYLKPAAAPSDFLARELARIRRLFKDSLVTGYRMSDSLYMALSSFKKEQVILADLEFRHFDLQHYTLLFDRLYVFDLTTKELIFYNLVIDVGAGRYRSFFDGPYQRVKRVQRLIRPYKRYLRKSNKSFHK